MKVQTTGDYNAFSYLYNIWLCYGGPDMTHECVFSLITFKDDDKDKARKAYYIEHADEIDHIIKHVNKHGELPKKYDKDVWDRINSIF